MQITKDGLIDWVGTPETKLHLQFRSHEVDTGCAYFQRPICRPVGARVKEKLFLFGYRSDVASLNVTVCGKS